MQDTLAKNLYQMWFAGKVVFLSFLKGNPGSKHMPTSRTSPFLGLSTRLLSQLIPLWDPGTGKTVIILHLGSQNFSVRSSLRVSTVIKIKVPGLIPQQRKKKEQSLAKHCIVPLCYMAVERGRRRERPTRMERNGGGREWGCFWFIARAQVTVMSPAWVGGTRTLCSWFPGAALPGSSSSLELTRDPKSPQAMTLLS